ncbi:MAG: uL15m family ribosomal protein [archaeon]
MKLKKRDTRSRIRGLRVCGYGHGKKHKGSGSKGGVGMAGTGKKAGQKVTLIHAKMPDYFGSHGFSSLQKMKRKAAKKMNIIDIEAKLSYMIEKGIAKKNGEAIELNLFDYKILGEGETKNKFIIKVRAISAGAREKIEKAGGKVIIEEQKLGLADNKEEKEEAAVKKEKPVAKKPAKK